MRTLAAALGAGDRMRILLTSPKSRVPLGVILQATSPQTGAASKAQEQVLRAALPRRAVLATLVQAATWIVASSLSPALSLLFVSSRMHSQHPHASVSRKQPVEIKVASNTSKDPRTFSFGKTDSLGLSFSVFIFTPRVAR